MNKSRWYPLILAVLGLGFAVSLTYFLTRSGFPLMMKKWGAIENDGANRAGEPNPKFLFSQKRGYWVVDFESLSSFPVEEPSALENMNTRRDDTNSDPYERGTTDMKKKTQIPGFIQALNGQKVEVGGFMIPLITVKDRVSSFILAQSQMTCCFGIAPKLNQWIYVTMEKGETTELKMDIPITVSGTLSVGRKYDEENKGWYLYKMVSDKVKFPNESWF